MPTPPAKLTAVAGERAQLDVPKEIAERAGLKVSEELSAFVPGSGVVVLCREQARKGYVAGALGALSVAELMGLINSGLRTVTLVLQGPTARRRFVFRDGQVVFASSTELSERMGPVIWRHGMITLDQLQAAEPKVSPTAKLGKVLMDAGLVSAAQLYRGMQLQVKEILFGAFIEAEGEFSLLDEGENPELNTVRLQERSRDLILEGMSRAEEMLLLRQAFDPEGVPKRKDGPKPTVMEQGVVWNRVDGKMSVRDVVRTSRLGDYAALKALRDLVGGGRVIARPPPPPKAPIARQASSRPAIDAGALQLFKSACERIRTALGPQAFAELRCFPDSLPAAQRGLFEGVWTTNLPDFERLILNAQKAHPGAMGRALALERVEGYLSFALFEARNSLPLSKAGELSREVAKCLKGSR